MEKRIDELNEQSGKVKDSWADRNQKVMSELGVIIGRA